MRTKLLLSLVGFLFLLYALSPGREKPSLEMDDVNEDVHGWRLTSLEDDES